MAQQKVFCEADQLTLPLFGRRHAKRRFGPVSAFSEVEVGGNLCVEARYALFGAG